MNKHIWGDSTGVYDLDSNEKVFLKLNNSNSAKQKNIIKSAIFSNGPVRMGTIALALLPLSACGSGGGSPTNSTPPPPPPADFTESPTNTFVARDDNDRTLDQGSATADLTVTGKGGNDTITTGSGADSIDGAAGNDAIISGDGDDTVIGGSGDDTIITGAGADKIRGGDGSDTITAGDGDDVIVVVGTTTAGQYTDAEISNPAGSGVNLSSLITLADLNDRSVSEVVSGETIDGGAGSNTLYIYGTIDLTGVTLTNVTTLIVNSDVILTAAQIAEFTTIDGDGNSVINIVVPEGSGEVVLDLSAIDLSDVGSMNITGDITVKVSDIEDLEGVDQITVNDTGSLKLAIVSDSPSSISLDGIAAIFEQVDIIVLDDQVTLSVGTPGSITSLGLSEISGTGDIESNGSSEILDAINNLALDSFSAGVIFVHNTQPFFSFMAIEVGEGDTSILNRNNFGMEDGQAYEGIDFIRVSNIMHGHFERNGLSISEFSLGELTEGLISFIHNGGEEVPSFKFSVKDGEIGSEYGILRDVSFSFTSMNDAPAMGDPTFAITKGGTLILGRNDFAISDVDDADFALSITVSNISHGQFEKANAAVTEFTLQDVADGLISFIHDGGEDAPSFDIAVKDDEGGASFSTPTSADISFTNANDAPVMGTPAFTITEGGSLVLTDTAFDITDVDDAASALTIQVSNISHGQFEKANAAVTEFTLQDVADGLISFIHDGGEDAPSFDIAVKDDEGGASFSTPISADISFTNANDAPVIGTPAFTITEGGSLVLTDTTFDITDVDDAASALIILVSNISHGQFEKANAAVTEFTLQDVADGLISFIHDGGEVAPSFDVAVKDDEGGASFSTPISADISFTNANDAPVMGTPAFTITEGGSLVLTDTTFDITDVDDAASALMILVSNISHGQFEKANVAITEFTLQDVADGLISFIHDGGEDAPSFDIAVKDDEVGASFSTPTSAGIDFINISDDISLNIAPNINTTELYIPTNSTPNIPNVAPLSDGGYVIVYRPNQYDAASKKTLANVSFQRFDALGNAQGESVKVNTTSIDNFSVYYIDVTGLSNDGFVIFWETHGNTNDLWVQVFNGDGSARGGEIKLGSLTLRQSDIVATDDGGFVLLTRETVHGLNFKKYDENGSLEQDNYILLGDYVYNQKITQLDDGNYFVVWRDPLTGNWDINANILNASGDVIGSTILVDNDPINKTYFHELSLLNDGNIAVAWVVEDVERKYSINVKIYDASGTEIASSSFNTNSDVSFVDVNSTLDNNFIVTWNERHENSEISHSVLGQIFDSNAVQINDPFQINNNENIASTIRPVSTTLNDGNIVVSWIERSFHGYGGNSPAHTIITPDGEPLISQATYTLTYSQLEGKPLYFGGSIDFVALDQQTLDTIVIAFTKGFIQAEDVLSFVNTDKIQFIYNSEEGILTLSVIEGKTALLSDFEYALAKVYYENISIEPNTEERALQIYGTVGNERTNGIEISINVGYENTSPTVDTYVEYNLFSGNTIAGNMNASDVDGDPLTFGYFQINDGDIILNKVTGDYTYTLPEVFSGTAFAGLSASDGKNSSPHYIHVNIIGGPPDILGTEYSDIVQGTLDGEAIISLAGHDIIYGNGGADRIFANEGYDDIYISDDQFEFISGGFGSDTLFLDGSGLDLDFSDASRFSDIENINLTGSGDNILTINVADFIDTIDLATQLFVYGDSGDTLHVIDIGWVLNRTSEINGEMYNVYYNDNNILYIDTDITQDIP